MRTRIVRFSSLVACATMVLSCSGSTQPSAPSTLSPMTSPSTSGGASFRPLEDPPAPMPAPEPAPPAPEPLPPPPPPVVISIVGTSGSLAFNPNPIQAAVGSQIVWTNFDAAVHRIVLDDGTNVGEVATGQSTAPVTLAAPSMGFHCTIHPSMVGTLSNAPALTPPPIPPDYTPPPYDYGYY